MLSVAICVGMAMAFLLGVLMSWGWRIELPRERPRPQQNGPMMPDRRPREIPARHQQITPPPMVGPVTLWDWLIHHTLDEDAWANVTYRFFQIVMERPHLASFFAGLDMEEQKKHFTSALVIVTHHGVTLATLLRMKEVHADVQDGEGRPITVLWFDEVIEILGGVLVRQEVPMETVRELVGTVAPLREAITLPSVRA